VLKEYILPVYVDVQTRKLALAGLQHEVTILESLHHPNIVSFTGFFVEDHRAYLVEEYLSGDSLRLSVEKNGPAPLLVTVKLALIMIDILAYLHSRAPRVIHRDFTPDNLIYDRQGDLKLIDFTVAQQGDESDLSTAVGKQCYLPPEQFCGRATTQSDIYAMGATIYFLLTGLDPEPLAQSQLTGKDGEAYDAINFVLARATALELRDRYQCVQEAREELLLIEHYLSDGAAAQAAG
jgi:serine/threonine protein kinase